MWLVLIANAAEQRVKVAARTIAIFVFIVVTFLFDFFVLWGLRICVIYIFFFSPFCFSHFQQFFRAAGEGGGVALRRFDIFQPLLLRRADAAAGNVQPLCQLDRFQTALDPHLFYLCHTRS